MKAVLIYLEGEDESDLNWLVKDLLSRIDFFETSISASGSAGASGLMAMSNRIRQELTDIKTREKRK